MQNLEDLGALIKSERKKLGLSRDKFAEKADICSRYLVDIENKNQVPSFKVLVKIIRALNISLDSIIYSEKQNFTNRKSAIAEKIALCNEKSLNIVEATLNAVLEMQNE